MTEADGCRESERALNRLMAEGRFRDGFERFYDDAVVMQENTGTETRGKADNRAREAPFWRRVRAMTATLLGGAVNGDVAYSEWRYVIEFHEGASWDYCQVARRRWRDGKVVSERFYHPDFPIKTRTRP
jgi:hypothetical protein